eukprot:8929481-Karenia_brevis.AAC.1
MTHVHARLKKLHMLFALHSHLLHVAPHLMAAQLEELFNQWCDGRPGLLHVYSSVLPSTSLEERYLSV